MKTYFQSYYLLFKTKLGLLITALSTFLLPIKPLLVTVGLFIAADTIMGIYRAKKKQEPITSNKLSNLVSKMVLYEAAVLLLFLMEKFILGEFVSLFIAIPYFLTKLAAATLCLIEMKSIDESFAIIKGYSLWDKFKGFLKRAKSIKSELKDFD